MIDQRSPMPKVHKEPNCEPKTLCGSGRRARVERGADKAPFNGAVARRVSRLTRQATCRRNDELELARLGLGFPAVVGKYWVSRKYCKSLKGVTRGATRNNLFLSENVC